MIITIDGPSGVGKTTIGIKLTITLNQNSKIKKSFYFLDTGISYRILANCIPNTENLNLHDHQLYNKIAEFENMKNDQDIENFNLKYQHLYTEEIALKTSQLSQIKEVRDLITKIIRKKIKEMSNSKTGFILTGRDCGTTILPKADYKFYLYASAETRAQRRFQQYINSGKKVDFKEILQQIIERDQKDQSRKLSPLPNVTNLPKDFILILSDNLSIEQTINEFLKYIKV